MGTGELEHTAVQAVQAVQATSQKHYSTKCVPESPAAVEVGVGCVASRVGVGPAASPDPGGTFGATAVTSTLPGAVAVHGTVHQQYILATNVDIYRLQATGFKLQAVQATSSTSSTRSTSYKQYKLHAVQAVQATSYKPEALQATSRTSYTQYKQYKQYKLQATLQYKLVSGSPPALQGYTCPKAPSIYQHAVSS
jgi:hypothetical protein